MGEKRILRSEKKRSGWLLRDPDPNDRIRVFCFPYAGSGASIYRQWRYGLQDNIGIYPIQLPGRENRIAETAFKEMYALVDKIAEEIVSSLNKPFILFGHSMGAGIAFELSHTLRMRWGISPLHLIVSARRAPHLPEPSPVHHLPELEFVNAIRRMAGTPEEVLSNFDLMEIFLPLLRADFMLSERYFPSKRAPLDCPITAIGGRFDREVSLRSVEAWRCHTVKKFSFIIFEGDHFFLHLKREKILNLISGIIRLGNFEDLKIVEHSLIK